MVVLAVAVGPASLKVVREHYARRYAKGTNRASTMKLVTGWEQLVGIGKARLSQEQAALVLRSSGEC